MSDHPKYMAPLLLEPGYRVLTLSGLVLAGLCIGYQLPRDVELESTKPIVFKYEVTPEAARILVSRSVEGLPKCEAPEQ